MHEYFYPRHLQQWVVLFFSQCSFSNEGHLFAAVSENVIQIYSSITFDNINNLKGHSGKVSKQILYNSLKYELVDKMHFEKVKYNFESEMGPKIKNRIQN